jgi:hypothetical protein
MSRYTASPFGIIPEYTADLKNFRYKSPTDAQTGSQSTVPQESIFSSSHKIDRSDNNDQLPVNYSPKLHEDEGYDLTTTNIIERLNGIQAMKLKYADFAYCRDFGVYPNNRLIICRKFGGPVPDDLNGAKASPVATVISWFDEASLPVAIDFGVDWVDAEGSFKNVLNNMGKDVGLDKIGIQLGDVATKGFNFMPLPGIFEPFTKQIINGIFGAGTVNERTVSGAPNLIKEAKQRKLIADDTVGSGLIGKLVVQVKCSWEQKFIMGQDPTHVYFDLLRAILHFGGEDGTFYAGSNTTAIVKQFLRILEDPGAFIAEMLNKIQAAIGKLIADVTKFITEFFDKQKIKDNTANEKVYTDIPGGKTGEQQKADDEKATKTAENKATNDGFDKNKKEALDNISKYLKIGTGGIGQKYKHVLLGIASALTGGPSTPWHVTIGNPLKPIFSSGDMWASSIKLTLGPTLAFNDLPSTIDIEFTLTSGRTYGIGEIFRKLSTGDVRIKSSSAPSFYNDEGEIEQDKIDGSGSPPTDNKDEQIADGLQPYEVNAQSRVDSTNAVGLTPSNGAQINPDPYSNPIQSPVQAGAQGGAPAGVQGGAPAGVQGGAQAGAQGTQGSGNPAASSAVYSAESTFEERVAASRAREAEEDRLLGITKPVEEPPQPWVPGKSAHAGGSRNQANVRISFNVFNGTSPGTYLVKWDLADTVYTPSATGGRDKRTGGQAEETFNSLSEAMTVGGEKIYAEFVKALANIGLTPTGIAGT